MESALLNLSHNSNFIINQVPFNQTYQYEVLSEAYLDQVTQLFTHAFCTDEPMTHYLQMDEKKYQKFAYAVAKQACEDQLSIIALDKKKVIAIALLEDAALPGKIEDFDPKFIYILSLLERLGENFFLNQKIAPKQIAHLFITAVDKHYRQQGLATQVNFRAMDLAAQHQFAFAYSEFTNYYNEKSIIPHIKNYKQLIGSCIYREFTYQNTQPFAHLEGGANAYLWEIGKGAK